MLWPSSFMRAAAVRRELPRFTESLGDIRWTPGWDDYSGYRQYSSWEAGMEDWYKLITDLYINQWGLRTVDDIIPRLRPRRGQQQPLKLHCLRKVARRRLARKVIPTETETEDRNTEGPLPPSSLRPSLPTVRPR